MKKNLILCIAALALCGTVNATSWRVCSRPESGANFPSVLAAVLNNGVFAGDTLYLEPGHVEQQQGDNNYITISKRVTIIGSGYYLNSNNINVINPNEAAFSISVYIGVNGVKIYGCKFNNSLSIAANSVIVERCLFTSELIFGSYYDYRGHHDGMATYDEEVKSCFFYNCNIRATGTVNQSIFENNMFLHGYIYDPSSADFANRLFVNCTFRSNTIYRHSTFQRGLLFSLSHCEVYNNIIINGNAGYFTTTNSNQTVDTTWYRNYVMDAPGGDGNDVHHNVLSCDPDSFYRDCVFNATETNTVLWNSAATIEEKLKHIANGPAVGAGVNGTTCGAYGFVNGGHPYEPAGIPQYRPYIYDADIDATPSSNNTINASFKIKVQQ